MALRAASVLSPFLGHAGWLVTDEKAEHSGQALLQSEEVAWDSQSQPPSHSSVASPGEKDTHRHWAGGAFSL